jgi:hypothetical protein
MTYIATDDSLDIKHGILTESPVRGSTARYICNPIVDDIGSVDPDGPADPIHPKIEYVPPTCLVTGDPSINDLAKWRWQGRTVDAETERQLIRRIQEGDPQCRAGDKRSCFCLSCRAFFDPRPGTISLLPAFHHSIRGIANEYAPKGSHRRQYKKDLPATEHDSGKRSVPASDSLIFQDLMAVGCFGLWKSVLASDFDKGCRLWTFAQPKISGLIARKANYLRQGGYTSGDTVGKYSHKKVSERSHTRLDRWIFDHLSAPPEELLEAQNKLGLKRPVYHSLEEAFEALRRADNLEHSEVYSDDGEDGSGDVRDTAATEALEEYRDVYQSHDPLYWSPQLAVHRDIVSPLVDFWISELFDPPRIKAKPNPRPVYGPCLVKPTGRVLHPIDKPYWMELRERAPDILERKPPYDPDRREVAVIPLKNGKTKRMYRQMAAVAPEWVAEWQIEYSSHPYAAPYAKYVQEQKEREINVRAKRSQANGSASANDTCTIHPHVTF